jgi:hypothetical protein
VGLKDMMVCDCKMDGNKLKAYVYLLNVVVEVCIGCENQKL